MTTKARAKPAKKSPVKKLQGKPAPEMALAPKVAEPKAPIHFNPVLCIVSAPEQKLWSLSLVERLRKQFATAGLAQTVNETEALTHNGPVVLVRGDAVIDQPLIPVLLKRPNFLLLSDDTEKPMPIAASARGSDVSHAIEVLRGIKPYAAAKLLARAPAQLDMEFWKSLRKRETPYAMIVTDENRSAVEWRMFMGTYKGATDV
ncbi:MAG: hypothetical protein ABL936_20460, partial [Aestuariivirga sp.]